MKQHSFCPVLDETKYENAIAYVVLRGRELAKTVLGMDLNIDTITLFTHQPNEYQFLESLLRQRGKVSDHSHGATLYVEVNKNINSQQVILLGVRQPDATRPEVGYVDFPVVNYDQIKMENSSNSYVSEIISGGGLHLLELKHPDFDVRGYVVKVR